jgi:hypothetical protein
MNLQSWLREPGRDPRFATLLQLGSLAVLDLQGVILAANEGFGNLLSWLRRYETGVFRWLGG